MSDWNIDCPNCGVTVELTEALAGPLLAAERRRAVQEAEHRFAADRAAMEAAASKTRAEDSAIIEGLRREGELRQADLEKAKSAEIAARRAKQEAEEAKRSIEVEVTRRVDEQSAAVAARARTEFEQQYAPRLKLAAAKMAEKDAKLAAAQQAELEARQAQQRAEEAQRDVELEVARRVAEQTTVVAARTRDEIEKKYNAELTSARAEVAEQDVKLAAAQQAEIEARRATRQAEEAKREAELVVARRMDEERRKVREAALKERDDEYRLKVAEKDKQLAALKDKLDEAQRKADQGSQQLQGEVLELDIHDALAAAFPDDEFERTRKGQKGGDVIQTVRSPSGVICGRIKWESKYTQNWNDAWLAKLRDDQREAKCELAALVTLSLPPSVAHFDLIESVWVSGIATMVPMAAALRRGLIETAAARRVTAAGDSRKDIVYTYLTGVEFRARVRGVVEPVVELRISLESEKRAAARQFAARDKQLVRIESSLSGMYGDLQGLVGPSLPSVEGLSLPELVDDEPLRPEVSVDAREARSESH